MPVSLEVLKKVGAVLNDTKKSTNSIDFKKLSTLLKESKRNDTSSSLQKLGELITQIKHNSNQNPQMQIGSDVIEFLKKNSPNVNRLNKIIFPFVKLWSNRKFKDFFEHAQKVLIPSFIKHDWYLSSRFLDEAGLEVLYYEEKSKNLDNKIISQFQRFIPIAKKLSLKQFPQRKKILKEIFYCYNRKQYSAVIALTYSSVEGIIYENFGQSFWGGKKKKNTEILRDNYKVTGVMNLFQKRFSDPGEMNKSFYPTKNNINIKSNNRHSVLHGHSYMYGTKKNAIKAILMIDFICEFVFWETKWKKYI